MIVDATTAGGTSLARSFKETVVVSTLTCSTKLTQKSKFFFGSGKGQNSQVGGVFSLLAVTKHLGAFTSVLKYTCTQHCS